MSFVADVRGSGPSGGAATGATTGLELSLEEALAFFDVYDDHTLLHTPTTTTSTTVGTNHSMIGGGGNAAFVHHQQQQFQHQQLQYQQQQQQYQLHQQQQQQQLLQHRQHAQHGNMAMTTDVLMMMDDASAEEFIAHDAFLGHSGVTDMNVDMTGGAGVGGADFGMMASMLEPLQLDDSLMLSSPATETPAPDMATPMQTLLTSPLAPTVKPTTTTTATGAKTTKARGGKTTDNSSPKVRQSAKAKAASPPKGSSAAKAASTASSSTAMVPKATAGAGTNGNGSSNTSTKRVRRQKEELLYLRTKVVELEERLQQLKRVNGETNSTRGSPAPSSSDDADGSAAAGASSSSSPARTATTSASTPSSTPTTSNSHPSPPQKSSSNNTNKSRKKPREEDSETDDAEDDSSSPSAISPALLASVWENVAERQYKERLRAEQQNKKLKTMLEGQIKLATSLEKILKKRPNMEVLYPDTESKPPKSQRVITYEETDEEIFKKQLEGIEKAYLRVDEVLEAAGFFTSEETRHDFRIKDFPDEDGVLMEFMATTTVPFDLAISGNALWRFMSDVGIKKHCYYEDVIHSSDDTFSRKFGVRVAEREHNVDLRGKHTLRKYIEKDRVVIMWKSLVEPIQLADAKMRGLRFSDVGWIVAQRSESSCEAGGGGVTLIKVYGHMCPCIPDESEDHQDEQIGALTDFVINCHESNAALCTQLINDLLVEEEWKTTLPVTL